MNSLLNQKNQNLRNGGGGNSGSIKSRKNTIMAFNMRYEMSVDNITQLISKKEKLLENRIKKKGRTKVQSSCYIYENDFLLKAFSTQNNNNSRQGWYQKSKSKNNNTLNIFANTNFQR